MQSGSEERASEEAPLYVRWNPDRSPYAVELRLDLVTEISNEVARAEKLGTEVGGVLVGSFPNAYSPTLRIDEVEIVPRGAEEGAIYVLDPGQHERFAEIRSRARIRQRDAVGFFRTHLRPGLLRPSLADRSLLSREFRDSLYAVLLIEGLEPHAANFFLAFDGHLSGEPSVRNFRFDEREFRALPEVQPEAATPRAPDPLLEPKQRSSTKVYGAKVYASVAALCAIAVFACILIWSFSRQTPLPHILGEANPINLSVMESGGLLRITWDDSAHEFDGASGATVLITDGASRREFKLGVDELRLGAIEYERSGSPVQVRMTVDGTGSTSSNQTVYWTGQ
jgi:hypothetical protein